MEDLLAISAVTGELDDEKRSSLILNPNTFRAVKLWLRHN